MIYLAIAVTCVIAFVIGVSVGAVTAENKFLKERDAQRQRELDRVFEDNTPPLN